MAIAIPMYVFSKIMAHHKSPPNLGVATRHRSFQFGEKKRRNSPFHASSESGAADLRSSRNPTVGFGGVDPMMALPTTPNDHGWPVTKNQKKTGR